MKQSHDNHPTAETLQAFLDGELPDKALRAIDDHLGHCVQCADEVESWQVLFSDLHSLQSLRPHEGFHDRVLHGVRVPEPTPLAARVRDRLSGLLPSRASGHLSVDRIHDLLEGFLPARQVARIRTHLDACGTCDAEVRGWQKVFGSLDALGRHAPAEGFADAVMASVELPAPVPARVAARNRIVAAARRLVPQTRRAWAALSGVAVTPAVTVGLVFYAVFSHPTLTPGALASFAWWQLTDAAVTLWSSAGAFASQGMAAFGLTALVEAVSAAPLLFGVGFVVYTAACVFALRVLYTHLVTSHPLDGRYARASS